MANNVHLNAEPWSLTSITVSHPSTIFLVEAIPSTNTTTLVNSLEPCANFAICVKLSDVSSPNDSWTIHDVTPPNSSGVGNTELLSFVASWITNLSNNPPYRASLLIARFFVSATSLTNALIVEKLKFGTLSCPKKLLFSMDNSVASTVPERRIVEPKSERREGWYTVCFSSVVEVRASPPPPNNSMSLAAEVSAATGVLSSVLSSAAAAAAPPPPSPLSSINQSIYSLAILTSRTTCRNWRSFWISSSEICEAGCSCKKADNEVDDDWDNLLALHGWLWLWWRVVAASDDDLEIWGVNADTFEVVVVVR